MNVHGSALNPGRDRGGNICDICGLSLSSRAAVKRHVKIHEKPDQILTEEELDDDIEEEEEEEDQEEELFQDLAPLKR